MGKSSITTSATGTNSQHPAQHPDVNLAEAVGRHILRMGGNEDRVASVTIFPSARNKEGWLEWLVRYEFSTGGKLTVGAIQRRPGEPVEFHS